MRVRYAADHSVEGTSSRFCGIGEVVVHFPDGDASSESIRDLDVELASGWKPLGDAFRDHDVVPDNHDVRFGRPGTREARERGWNW